MKIKELKKYFELFNPDMYNPEEWAKKTEAAGMKYAVITTNSGSWGYFRNEKTFK